MSKYATSPTPLALQLLIALAEGDDYGYHLSDRIRRESRGTVVAAERAVYLTLTRLCENGLVERTAPEASSRIHNFHLTTQGLTTLKREQTRLAVALALMDERI